MTSSCCTRGGRVAVPYSNLRGAIGTFHAGKSADLSRKVSLHRSFLHRRSYAAVPHRLSRDAIGTSHTEKPANSSCKVTLHGNFLARIPTQFAHPFRGLTATPRNAKAVGVKQLNPVIPKLSKLVPTLQGIPTSPYQPWRAITYS